ncbi:MAG: hypothetical protein V1897_19800 [Pseudomonadota bacterium]
MNTFWEITSQMQVFFQLNFLLSGLELSSGWVFLIRSLVFLTCLIGFVWGFLTVIIKILDVTQAAVNALGPLPKSFYLLLLLIIPLPDYSLGSKWIGYILLTISAMVFSVAFVLTIVMWKYGIDQTLRLINFFRSRSKATDDLNTSEQCFSENVKSTL